MFRTYNDMYRTPISTTVEVDSKIYCDLCDAGGWSTDADLEIHRKTQHRETLLKMLNKPSKRMCHTCLFSHKSAKDLISHIKIHHLLTAADSERIERQIFICELCNHIFFNKNMIIAHLTRGRFNNCKRARVQWKNQRLDCPRCDKKVHPKRMWFHLLYHGTFSSSTCPICVESFSSTKSMMEHVQGHCAYTCGICGLDMNRKSNFLKHIAIHKRRTEIDCPDMSWDLIKKYFVSVKDWELRSRLAKSNLLKGSCISPPVHVCVVCRQICIHPKEMRRHVLNDHAPEEDGRSNAHMCGCGEQFFNAVMLKHHAFQRACSYYKESSTDCGEL